MQIPRIYPDLLNKTGAWVFAFHPLPPPKSPLSSLCTWGLRTINPGPINRLVAHSRKWPLTLSITECILRRQLSIVSCCFQCQSCSELNGTNDGSKSNYIGFPVFLMSSLCVTVTININSLFPPDNIYLLYIALLYLLERKWMLSKYPQIYKPTPDSVDTQYLASKCLTMRPQIVQSESQLPFYAGNYYFCHLSEISVHCLWQ